MNKFDWFELIFKICIGIVVLIIGLCSAFILYGGIEMFFEEMQKINEPIASSLAFILLGGVGVSLSWNVGKNLMRENNND
jgi:uncharacterized SAM-binding protein YcdF (DUF218 family)